MGLRSDFDQSGAVILPAFFDAGEIAGVHALLDGFRADADSTSREGRRRSSSEYATRFDTLVDVFRAHDEPAAEELLRNPRLDEVTRELIGDYDLSLTASFGTRQGCGQGWHQDTASDEPGRFVLNRIVFTEDVEADRGPLYYVPGSHRMGDLPRGGNHEPIEGNVEVLPTAGMLVLMHSRCYHRVGLNRSDRMRIQINTRAAPRGAPKDLADYAVFRNATWQHSRQAPFRGEPD